MKKWVTDELVRSIIRMCRCENCGCGVVWPISPVGEEDPRLARANRSPVRHPKRSPRAPTLHLVPNCGSLLKIDTPPSPAA